MSEIKNPTTEVAGEATSSVTKFQCKGSENQRPAQQSDEFLPEMVKTKDEELDYLTAMVENPTEPPVDKVNIGVLTIKEANEWCAEAAQRPDPKPLWLTLWYEGELSCLFADTNLGKSIYAVQIAVDMSKSAPVLYCDFELSDKQFQLRYLNQDNGNLYSFPATFKRAELSPDALAEQTNNATFEDYVIDSIEESATTLNINRIVIDNLTWICNASEKGDAAGILMAKLLRLKKQYNWSILVIAHTPKRPLTSPIDQNTLAGSKKLINFFDSAFAIGRSAKDENLRYVKQIKCRHGKFEYGADNIIVADITQDSDGFVHFNHIGYAHEREHLKEVTEKEVADLDNQILELHNQGKTQREIGKEVGVSVGKVNKVIKNHK